VTAGQERMGTEQARQHPAERVQGRGRPAGAALRRGFLAEGRPKVTRQPRVSAGEGRFVPGTGQVVDPAFGGNVLVQKNASQKSTGNSRRNHLTHAPTEV
jgi:hypothetical protein